MAGDAAGGQHRIGLGEPRFDHEQDRGGHQGGREECSPPPHEGEAPPNRSAAPSRSLRKARGCDKGRSWCGLRAPPRASATATTRALQPIDADRLLVSGLVLKADVDEVAGFQHLLRSLREARLVPVHRLQRDLKPGRKHTKHSKTSTPQIRRWLRSRRLKTRLARGQPTRDSVRCSDTATFIKSSGDAKAGTGSGPAPAVAGHVPHRQK